MLAIDAVLFLAREGEGAEEMQDELWNIARGPRCRESQFASMVLEEASGDVMRINYFDFCFAHIDH
jgi:hypothetical protein